MPLHHSLDNEYGVASSVGGGLESKHRLENGRRSSSQDLNFIGSSANNMRYHEGGTTTDEQRGYGEGSHQLNSMRRNQ